MSRRHRLFWVEESLEIHLANNIKHRYPEDSDEVVLSGKSMSQVLV